MHAKVVILGVILLLMIIVNIIVIFSLQLSLDDWWYIFLLYDGIALVSSAVILYFIPCCDTELPNEPNIQQMVNPNPEGIPNV